MLARLRSSWAAVVPVAGLIMLAVTGGVSSGPVLATVIAAVRVVPAAPPACRAIHLVLFAAFLFLATFP